MNARLRSPSALVAVGGSSCRHSCVVVEDVLPQSVEGTAEGVDRRDLCDLFGTLEHGFLDNRRAVSSVFTRVVRTSELASNSRLHAIAPESLEGSGFRRFDGYAHEEGRTHSPTWGIESRRFCLGSETWSRRSPGGARSRETRLPSLAITSRR